METLILIVHVLVALALIGLIMLQQGKGAETGASFGSGASQTVFGSQGSGNFLTRTTAILATVFFVTSIGLAMIAKDKANALTSSTISGIPAEVSVPAGEVSAPTSDVPEVGDSTVDSSEVPVVDSSASAGGDGAKEAE